RAAHLGSGASIGNVQRQIPGINAITRRNRQTFPMTRMSPASVIVAASLIATTAGAQTLRGVVVDAGDRPISGVVITLVDSASTVAARGLTNDRGEFRLTAAKDGAYQVRTLRIGFRPTVSDRLSLQKSTEVSKRIVLTDVPVVLDTVRATSQS